MRRRTRFGWMCAAAPFGFLLAPAGQAVAQNPAPPAPPAVPAAVGDAPLTLGAAFQAALTTPVATSAQQQFAQAQARVAQARAQQRAQITLLTSAGVSNGAVIQPPPSRETFGTLTNTLSVPLPIGRKPRLLTDQSVALSDAALAQQNAARLAVAGKGGDERYDLLRKQALLQIANDTLATAQRQQGDAEKRYRAGDVPELDVLRARSPVATAQAGAAQAENAVLVARETLNNLIGKPLDAPLTIATVDEAVVNKPLPLTLDEAKQQARDASPDVQAADASVRAARLGRQVAGQARAPGYSVEFSDARGNDQTGFSRLNTIQASISIPLSDGGLAKAQAREADAALKQAEAQAETARRTAETTASVAYVTARSSISIIASAQEARALAQTAYDKTARGYQNGLFPLTDVLSAQSALTQARIAYIQAVYDAASAENTLQVALGVLPK